MPLRFTIVLGLALCACGPRKGPEAGQIYFWQISTSTLEWGACGDATALREGVGAIAVADNSYLVYRVDPTGKKAITQTCPTLDPRTCSDSATQISFDIAGAELTFTSERLGTVKNSACKVQENETWTLVDQIDHMSLEIATVLSLVGSDVDCPKLDASIKAESPNGLGISGCVLTRQLNGSLK